MRIAIDATAGSGSTSLSLKLARHYKLRYLDTLDPSILYKSDAIPYDYAILCEFKALEKKFKVNIVPLHGPTLNLKSANECDFIFCIYESVFSFMSGGYKGYNNYINVLTKTKATVHPP